MKLDSWFQGDQIIGRLFSLGSYFDYRSSQNISATFFHYKSSVSILTKYGLGYILGDFFSQTHLVTLVGWKENRCSGKKHVRVQSKYLNSFTLLLTLDSNEFLFSDSRNFFPLPFDILFSMIACV
jgi:hypothetical protein